MSYERSPKTATPGLFSTTLLGCTRKERAGSPDLELHWGPQLLKATAIWNEPGRRKGLLHHQHDDQALHGLPLHALSCRKKRFGLLSH